MTLSGILSENPWKALAAVLDVPDGVLHGAARRGKAHSMAEDRGDGKADAPKGSRQPDRRTTADREPYGRVGGTVLHQAG